MLWKYKKYVINDTRKSLINGKKKGRIDGNKFSIF